MKIQNRSSQNVQNNKPQRLHESCQDKTDL